MGHHRHFSPMESLTTALVLDNKPQTVHGTGEGIKNAKQQHMQNQTKTVSYL